MRASAVPFVPIAVVRSPPPPPPPGLSSQPPLPLMPPLPPMHSLPAPHPPMLQPQSPPLPPPAPPPMAPRLPRSSSPTDDWLKVAAQVALMNPLQQENGMSALGALSLPPYVVAAA